MGLDDRPSFRRLLQGAMELLDERLQEYGATLQIYEAQSVDGWVARLFEPDFYADGEPLHLSVVGTTQASTISRLALDLANEISDEPLPECDASRLLGFRIDPRYRL